MWRRVLDPVCTSKSAEVSPSKSDGVSPSKSAEASPSRSDGVYMGDCSYHRCTNRSGRGRDQNHGNRCDEYSNSTLFLSGCNSSLYSMSPVLARSMYSSQDR